MIDRVKTGSQNKKKGTRAENDSADFWSKIFNSDIRRSPRSGAFLSFPGDLTDFGNSILKEFVVDSKFGIGAIPKKIEDQMVKLGDEAQGKMYFLEINNIDKEPYIVMTRKHFARLLKELQGSRKYEN